ncbi:MAG: hypothetical protein ACYDEN_08705 [Acidimicrobiales bacterium]
MTFEPWNGGNLQGLPRRDVNGWSAYRAGRSPAAGTRWAVPRLHVQVTVRGAAALRVFDTLTTSPRAALLTAPLGAVPPGWRWHRFAGVRFATPATWPTERTSMHNDCTSSVALGGRAVEPESHTVVIAPDRPQVSAALPFDFLTIEVVTPGRSMPVQVRIGLAGDGSVALGILASLRPD